MYFIVIYVCLLPLEILFDCCFDLVLAAERTSRGGNSEVTVPLYICWVLISWTVPIGTEKEQREIGKSKEAILPSPSILIPLLIVAALLIAVAMLLMDFVASSSSSSSRWLVVRCSKPLQLGRVAKNLKTVG